MSKTFLGVVCGPSLAVNVVSHFVNEDVVEVKVPDGIAVAVAEFKRMSTEENTLAPVETVATKRTGPGPLLLSGACQNEYGTKSAQVLGRHPVQPILHLSVAGSVDEIGRNRRQRNNAWESWVRRESFVEAFVCRATLGQEWIIKRPIRELGFAVGVASRPR